MIPRVLIIYLLVGLANTLDSLGLRMGRLKTGTPPRLKADTIDYSGCAVQKGDDPPVPFSFMNDRVWIDVSSNLTYLEQESSVN